MDKKSIQDHQNPTDTEFIYKKLAEHRNSIYAQQVKGIKSLQNDNLQNKNELLNSQKGQNQITSQNDDLIVPTQDSLKYEKNKDSNFLLKIQQYIKDFESTPNNFQQYIQKETNDKQNFGNPKTCSCQKTNCLKLYCSCFKQGMFCSEDCVCDNCINTELYKDTVSFVTHKKKMANKFAFSSNIIIIEGNKLLKNGCECTTLCKNRHCNCIKFNVSCHQLCSCINCKNQKKFIQQLEKTNDAQQSQQDTNVQLAEQVSLNEKLQAKQTETHAQDFFNLDIDYEKKQKSDQLQFLNYFNVYKKF